MPEPKQRIIVDGMEFASIFLFPRVLRSAISALQPPRLIIALLLVTALITAGRLWDRYAPADVPPGGLAARVWTPGDRTELQQTLRQALIRYVKPDAEGWPTADSPAWPMLDARRVVHDVQRAYTASRGEPGASAADDQELADLLAYIESLRPLGPFEAMVRATSDGFSRIMRGLVTLQPPEVLAGAEALFVRIPGRLWRTQPTFTIVYGIVALIVLAVGGGALARMAACQWAVEQRIPIREAVDFALSRAWQLMLAPLLPLVMAALLALFIAVLGLLVRLPWVLEVIGGLAFGLALLAGALLAFLLVGYAGGAVMLIPSIACENSDAADAQQRVYAYVINRPLHLIGYVATAIVGLALGYLLVSVLVVVTLNVTSSCFGLWAGQESALASTGRSALFQLSPPGTVAVHLSAAGRGTAWLLTFWRTLVLCLVPAYVVSYLFTSSSILYLLMRRACDGQDMEEIWQPGLIPGTLAPEPGPLDVLEAAEQEEE